MEDFILGLLWCILEILLEGLFEYVLAAPFDLCFRALRAIFDPEFPNAVLAAIGYALLGFAAGGLSLIYFPHPLVHPSRIHGASLLVSPMITGLLMSLTGSFLRKRDKRVLQFESFWGGFAFGSPWQGCCGQNESDPTSSQKPPTRIPGLNNLRLSLPIPQSGIMR